MMFPMDPVGSVRPPSWETHLLGPEQPGTRFFGGGTINWRTSGGSFPKVGDINLQQRSISPSKMDWRKAKLTRSTIVFTSKLLEGPLPQTIESCHTIIMMIISSNHMPCYVTCMANPYIWVISGIKYSIHKVRLSAIELYIMILVSK